MKHNIPKPNHQLFRNSEPNLDKTLSEESTVGISSGDFSMLERALNKEHHHSESYLDKTVSKKEDSFPRWLEGIPKPNLDKVKVNLENKNYSLETNYSINSKIDMCTSSIVDLKLDKNKKQQSKEINKEEYKKMGAIPKGSKIVSNESSTSGCKPYQEAKNRKDDDFDKRHIP